MGLFNRKPKNGGFKDQIRCDESSYLIWKWHPAGVKLGEGNRENSIRCGSSLRVKDGEVAVFVYKQKSGQMQDFIVGPFDQKLKTANLPVLASVVGLAYEGGTPFQAEIYFINLARVVQVSFGVPFFDVYDARFADVGVPVAARGTVSFRIIDYKQFIKLHRLVSFDLEDFSKQIQAAIYRYVKDKIANAPARYGIPVVQIERKIAQINEDVEREVVLRLQQDFGVFVSGVDISAVELDKASEGYRQLMRVTREIEEATVQAEAQAKIKDIEEKQRIEAEDYEENLRIQREEAQYATRKETQSKNIAAFQIEKRTEVGVAGAEALGKMGEKGAGDVNLGGGNGFNMAAMMASMAVGGAVGKNIAGAMNTMMGDGAMLNQTPPPLPPSLYYVGVGGKPTGPFDILTLSTMASAGTFFTDSLVWKNGMTSWTQAGTVEELKTIFTCVPPPLP